MLIRNRGLAAARAAQGHAPQAGQSYQYRQDFRPVKRQKIGPVVTKYPPPGPVVTRYQVPPQATPYTQVPNSAPSSYGPTTTQYQPNAFDLQHAQPYPQSAGGPTAPYSPYGQPVASGFPQPYGPNPGGAFQGYPQVQGPYYQPYNQAAPYGYGPTLLSNQQAGYNQPPYQQGPYGYGQYPAPHKRYNMPSGPAQYGPSPQFQQGPQWVQPPNNAPPFQAHANAGPAPYQHPYSTRHPQHNPGSRFHHRGGSNASGFNNNRRSVINSQQGSPVSIEPSRASSVSSHQDGLAAPTNQASPDRVSEADDDYDHDFMYAFKASTFSPCKPIGRPLPSFYSEQPIPPPAPDAIGPICKYIRPANLDIYIRDIRKSPHWPFVKDDPVFDEIAWDAPTIPLEELIAWVRGREPQDVMQEVNQTQPSVNPRKRSWSEDTQDNTDKQVGDEVRDENPRELSAKAISPVSRANGSGTPPSGRSSTPTVGREITPSIDADDDAWVPKSSEGECARSAPSDPTEALLASLGVTGSPKPVSEKPLSISTAPIDTDTKISHSHSPLESNITPSALDERKTYRQDSGYSSARGSVINAATNSQHTMQTPSDHGYRRQDQRPPPPPPFHPRQLDGSFDSPESDGSARDRMKQSDLVEANAVEQEADDDEEPESPLSPTSAELLGQLPGLGYGSNGRRPEPLRQMDDVTPKLKRRQPQVAEAYR